MTAWSLLARQCKAPDRGGCEASVSLLAPQLGAAATSSKWFRLPVLFQPFVGIGPRRYFDLFSMNLGSSYDLVRKDSETGEASDYFKTVLKSKEANDESR